jgi:hypothetical protein
VFSISFIFCPGTYDDEFHRLDAATQAVADATEGFLGSETWWSDDRSVCNAVYYWDDLAHLPDFARAARTWRRRPSTTVGMTATRSWWPRSAVPTATDAFRTSLP